MKRCILPGVVILLAAAYGLFRPPPDKALPGWDEAAPRPNVIYILADDLGYGDLACYGGSHIETPHVDRLAAGGLRFTRHYAASPICVPSRFSLHTGLHTGHHRFTENGCKPFPDDLLTVHTLLKQAGYRTGHFGHLWQAMQPGSWGLDPGGKARDPDIQPAIDALRVPPGGHTIYPEEAGEPYIQGIDELLTIWRRESRPLDQVGLYWPVLWRGGDQLVQNTDYLEDAFVEGLLSFIRKQDDERPFFAAYWSTIPHRPLQVPGLVSDDIEVLYKAMVERLDDYVGQIMDALESADLAGNTLVFFSSDNGSVDGSNGHLRGGKASLYEGGIRVPFIAHWPKLIQAGRVTDHLCSFTDLLPTLAGLSGVATPQNLDGYSLLPTLSGHGEPSQHAYLYWWWSGNQAVRSGKWKALYQHQQDLAYWQLFDVEKDPGEQQDLASAHPEVLTRLKDLARQARVPPAPR
ncbi:MAG: sulfatase-like hydrolase/transferase [Verrucomicrobiota bacterium]